MSSETKKYRLGNPPETCALREEYVGWLPHGYSSWADFQEIWPGPRHDHDTLVLVGVDDQMSVELYPYQIIIKDAFPLEFYGEERAKDWTHFLIVGAADIPDEKFIIPMH